jgi:hypothetical protein
MFYSPKYDLLFIAIPKTGTRSIEDALGRVDPSGERHKITLDNRTIDSSMMYHGVVGHARAWELRDAIGNERYDNMKTVAFIRDPFSKLVSSYSYNKSMDLRSSFRIKGNNKRYLRIAKDFITKLIPKMLPFKIWALIYPMKSNMKYIFDRDGKKLVKYIGRTEYLEEDLVQILQHLNIVENHIDVKHINRSNHKEYEKYFGKDCMSYLIKLKYNREYVFYKTISAEIHDLSK